VEQAREARQVGRSPGNPKPDRVPQAEAPLEISRCPLGQDQAPLQEGDLVAQLLRLPHVVGAEKNRDPLAGTQFRDLRPDLEGHVRVEAHGRLVEKQEFRSVDETLGECEALLEPGGELVVGDGPVWGQFTPLKQLLHANAALPGRQAIEAGVEVQDLRDLEAPDEVRVAADQVQALADGGGLPRQVVSEERGPAAIGGKDGGEDGEEGRLAGPVRPDDAVDGPGGDAEGDPGQRLAAPWPQPAGDKGLGQSLRFHNPHGAPV